MSGIDKAVQLSIVLSSLRMHIMHWKALSSGTLVKGPVTSKLTVISSLCWFFLDYLHKLS